MPDELAFQTEEERFIRLLLEDDVEVVIPDNISHETLWSHLCIASKISAKIDRFRMRIRPLIARILIVARENPQFYRDRGYESFDQFLRKGVEQDLGLGRTVAYECMAVARICPSLPPAEYEQVGSPKLNILGRFTDETKPGWKDHLEYAKTHSRKELIAHAEELKQIAKGEATPATIVISTTREVAHVWRKFVSDQNARSECGTDNEGLILLHAIEEVSNEWGVDLS